MNKTKHIWLNGKLVKWADAKIHVMSHALHYGTGAFEGVRFYKTEKGPAIFQLKRHVERWVYSMECLDMKIPYTQDELEKAIIKTVKVNKVKSGYIRPIAFYGYGPLRVNPIDLPIDVAIACWPWGSYLGDEAIKMKVSPFVRIHPKSTYADAKISGHYVNAMLAVKDAVKDGYGEALMLDYKGYVAEGSAENLFIVKDGVIYTPELGTILAGITRESIMELAKNLGYKVKEKKMKLDDIHEADECFLTGTAAEVSPVGQIDNKKLKTNIGPITKQLKEEFMDIVSGKNPEYFKWLTFLAK